MNRRFFIALLLCCVVIAALFSGCAAMAEEDPVFTYTVNDDGLTATITAATGDISGTLSIPAELDGYTVTAIGAEAFRNSATLTGVVIPNTVTYIGSSAF